MPNEILPLERADSSEVEVKERHSLRWAVGFRVALNEGQRDWWLRLSSPLYRHQSRLRLSDQESLRGGQQLLWAP